jgi:ABC-type multidrug transport system fused ATPase/permease subunit
MIKRYLEISQEDTKYIIIGLISGGIASYYSVYVNEYTSQIMQGDFSSDRLWELFVSSFYTIVFTSLRGSCFTYSQKSMNHRLRCIIYNRLLHQSTDYYETMPVSTILERVTNDVRIVSDIISLNINVISRSVINIIVTFCLLMNISYKLTFIAFCITSFNFLISHVHDKCHQHIMKGFDDTNKELNTHMHETITHISIIKTFAAEEKSSKQLFKLSDLIAQYFFKESILYAFNAFIVFNMPVVTTIMIILTANYLEISKGLVSFILHQQSVYSTIKGVIDFKNEFVRCKEPFYRIMQILDTRTTLETSRGYYAPANFTGSIQFKNVSFKYQKADANILTSLNFHIKAGNKIAIIGASGCGKSTLAKMLIGIITPTDGQILFDGVNVSNYDNNWLKKQIGYVAQDSILFSDTIANNIAYGLDNYNIDDVINAAKMANADEFISKLPNQYDTRLEGTELSSLSGGQKQRIAIARALMRKPMIIIFDEATSALDPYCEEIVQNTIKECFRSHNSTMIVIAHRRSALDLADKIYKLEDSVLIEL